MKFTAKYLPVLILLMTSALAGDVSTNVPVPHATTNSVEVLSSTMPRVVAYYFHRTGRCHGCFTIERLTRQAVDEFKEENPGVYVTLQVINLDEPENEHFVQDFDLSFNTVVIASSHNNRVTAWTNLNEQVWSLYSDEGTYLKFLKTELDALQLLRNQIVKTKKAPPAMSSE